MERWYVVYTQAHAEERALWHLCNQGFKCFLPKFMKLRRHARRSVMALEPLFPRYLFTWFDSGRMRWRSINGSRGVVSLLMQQSSPIAVAPGVVEDLMTSADKNAVIPAAALKLLSSGLKVRLGSGAFEGQFAEVEELAENGMARVRLLMALLGQHATLHVPAYAIEPV